MLHLSHGICKLSSRAFQSPQRRNAIKKERKKAPGIINKAFGFTLFEVCATFFSLFSSNVLGLKENINKEPLKVF